MDPVYYEYTDDWSKYEDMPTVELGPVQENGKRWVSKAQIYVRSASDREIGPETSTPGMFLAGEVVTVPSKWKIPTMEQSAVSGKQAAKYVFEYLGVPREVDMSSAEVNRKAGARVSETLVSALANVTKKLK